MRKLQTSHIFRSITAAVLIAFTGGCASSTMIRSTDPDAKIYIDGEYRGVGQVQHTDTKIVGASTSVKIEKPGCEPQSFVLNRSEEFQVGACIGGVLVLVPFLWIMGYKSEHNYEYACRATAKP